MVREHYSHWVSIVRVCQLKQLPIKSKEVELFGSDFSKAPADDEDAEESQQPAKTETKREDVTKFSSKNLRLLPNKVEPSSNMRS